MSPELEHKLDALPASPGVYLFKGKEAEVIYVGKARSLKSRVRSYFQAGTSDSRYFVSLLSRELSDIETIVVGSEKEAALLENTLIKQHQPRYNIKLRDDKDFLSLRLDSKARWARLEVVRKPAADGALYFGPYHSATAARVALRLVNRHFQLRTCTDVELSSRTRPCLQYQIKRCLAPCVKDVSVEHYAEQIEGVAMFLDGRHDELSMLLEERMQKAAAELAYERAATARDQLRAIERVRENNRVAVLEGRDQDVLGLYRQADLGEVAVLMIRAGKLGNVRTFPLRGLSAPDDEIIAQFVADYYGPGTFVPQEVLLPLEIEAMEGLAEVLSDQRGKPVRLLAPKRGPRADIVQMARDNASHAFREKARAREDVEARLCGIMEKLRLPRLPRRIECIDISHTGGTDTVAAIVALENGAPNRRAYRTFHLKGVDGGDDYGAMREVLRRRLKRASEGEGGWELPDLLVVDGGRGQLNVALGVVRELGLGELCVAALAKEKLNVNEVRLVDRIYLEGQKNPIELRESHTALSVLALARDEAHRFSNAARTKLGKRTRLRSELDTVKGIGKTTKRKLLAAFGSVRAIAEADEASLRSAGATVAQARALIAALRGPSDSSPAPAREDPLARLEELVPAEQAVEDAEEAALDHAFGEGRDEARVP